MNMPCSATIEMQTTGREDLAIVRLSGLITADEHEKCLADPVRRMRERYGKYRLLVEFDEGFRGWEPEAADLNMRIIIECAQDCERVAYVNPPPGKILQMKLAPQLIGGQIRFYDLEDIEEALAWLKEPS